MSDDADDASKTEEPTAKKLEKAHGEGQWPLSAELGNALVISAILLIVMIWFPRMVTDLMRRLSFYVAHVDEIVTDTGGLSGLLVRAVFDMVAAVWLPLLLLCVAGVYGTVFQKGWYISWKSISPKFSKLNPINGFKNIFSLGPQAMELGKSLAKLAVVGGLAYLAIEPMLRTIEHFIGIELVTLVRELRWVVFRLLIGVAVVVGLIAATDVFYQRFTYNKKMRMTKQEVKDEHKQSEGDPQVKARIRQIRMERVRKRMMAAVPTASVVVTNPTHFAVALKYEPGEMGAPVMVAKGADNVAKRIREVATENKVPIVENPPLARALYASVEVDEEIPAEHYRAVAEVISYVMKLRRGAGR